MHPVQYMMTCARLFCKSQASSSLLTLLDGFSADFTKHDVVVVAVVVVVVVVGLVCILRLLHRDTALQVMLE